MAKINKEEYEILKSLDDEWKWIARDDKHDKLFAYELKPYKNIRTWFWRGNSDLRRITEAGFQFIQWKDGEPYSIAELIDEYETEFFKNAKIVNLDASEIAGNASDYKHFYKRVGESEETEVKDKEWLKDEIRRVGEVKHYIPDDSTVEIELPVLDYAINQLDEPEVLSSDWIKDNEEMVILTNEGHDDFGNVYSAGTMVKGVPSRKLQNLLVPTPSKKVQLSQKEADELNRYKERGYSLKDLLVIAGSKKAQEKLARAWLDGYEVEEEQKYYVLLPEIVDNWRYVSLAPNHWGVTVRYTDTLDDVHEFTEQEIKDYDERYIAFAKPVEELEE